jgi:hypothetical protein
MGGRPGRGAGYLILLLVVCGLAGGFIGEAIGVSVKTLGFLKNSINIGMPQPVVLNLKLVTLTFGINFTINIFSLLGVLLGYYIYKKM